jgi:hypothetical protein
MTSHLYASVTDLKHTNRLNFNDSDSVSDDMLEAIIEAVSRKIDDKCNRVFWADSDDVVRYYTATDSNFIFTKDIASPSSDVTVEIDTNGDGTYDNTLASTDFVLEPYNAEIDGVPYQKITVSSVGQHLFPSKVIKGVKVTAKWGWPTAVPPPIVQAVLLQSERLFKRFSTPLGSESMTALGKMTLTIPALDPDVEFLISRYIKVVWG